MSDPVRLVIHGASGRMGQSLLRVADARVDVETVAAIVRDGSSSNGRSVGIQNTSEPSSLRYTSSLADAITADVLIDFAGAEAFDAALQLAVQRKLAFVSGSTGLSPAQFDALDRAAEKIPVIWAANFSLGVAALAHLAQKAARMLAQWDCEIIEAHHSRKLDAPSGTALMLGREVASARGITEHTVSTDRSGARRAGEIGYAVVRGGDIVGEHDVLFIGEGERVELAHRATNRDIFARGAVTAALWIAGKEARRYEIADVLGL
jgi:4-hydroxy-tetrahydrodipicolinate reductase